MGTVLLATDGSDYARQAARHAVDLAEEAGSTLHIIGVVDERRLGEQALSTAELATIYAEEDAATAIVEATELAASRNVSVRPVSRRGVPHDVVIDYADEIDADTIVIGEHGAPRTHLSGVGRRIERLADCDVVVVEAEPAVKQSNAT